MLVLELLHINFVNACLVLEISLGQESSLPKSAQVDSLSLLLLFQETVEEQEVEMRI